MVLVVFGLMLVLMLLWGCNRTIEEPEIPELMQYRAEVKATYDRNVAKITFPEGNDWGTIIRYRLYDPEAEKNKLDDGVEYVEWNYRIGVAKMEKIAENRFVGYLKKVFVQTQSLSAKHELYIRDLKLQDGPADISAENITIEGAYDIEIKYGVVYFKMSAQTTRR